MLALIALWSSLELLVQEPASPKRIESFEVHPEDPLHRFVEVVVGPEGATIDWTSNFEGTLTVWAESDEVDPRLRVVLGDADPIEDDDSGGGKTAFARVQVSSDTLLALTATAVAPGLIRLHWVASPETTTTRSCAAQVSKLLDRAEDAKQSGVADGGRQLLSNALDLVLGVEEAHSSDAIMSSLRQLGHSAWSLDAIETFSTVCHVLLAHCERTLPENHPDLLLVRLSLAAMMSRQGDLTGARALEEAVLAGFECTLPEDHPDLLLARSNLAMTANLLGDLAGARVLQEAALAGFERTLPEDHPDLLGARVSLAGTMARQGDLAGARVLQEAALAGFERTLPEDHPDLLGARLSLAGTMRQQGNLAGARVLAEAVLAGFERTLPEDHPSLLAARLSLAGTMHEQGELAGARALGEAALAGFERALPEDHPNLLLARSNLAATMKEQGDLAGARALVEAALAGFERTFPGDHPDLLGARLILAGTMRLQGDLAGARALEESVLACYERAQPEDHLRLLRTRLNLAMTMEEQGDLTGARALTESVLADYERALPEDHPDLLRARLKLSRTMLRQGDLAGTRTLAESALAGYERTLPEGHPDLLRARLSLAVIVQGQGDLAAACVLGSKLVSGMLTGLEAASLSFARREARAIIDAKAHWHSAARFFSSSDESEGARLRLFDLAETLRSLEIGYLSSTSWKYPELIPLRDEIAEVRIQIGDLFASDPTDAGAKERGSLRRSIDELVPKRDRLERALNSELRRRSVHASPIRAEAVAKALSPDAVAIGFLRTEAWQLIKETQEQESRGEVIAAHALYPDGRLIEVELGGVGELSSLVEAWRWEIGEPLSQAGRTPGLGGGGAGSREVGESSGERLRAKLLDPLLRGLDESTRIYLCAADLVHAVPIEALPLGDGVVGDRYRIVHLSSFAPLVTPIPQQDDAEPEMLAVGDVNFDVEGASLAVPIEAISADIESGARNGSSPGFLVALPGTRIEVEAIAKQFAQVTGREASVLLEGKATKAAFHELAPGKQYIHIATHGWFTEMQFDEPEEGDPWSSRWGLTERVQAFSPLSHCGLAFTGANLGRNSVGRVPGIMTAEELAGVDLSSCELAILSACETNVGLRSSGLAIQSLQAALHAAGARRAITSLWKVDDKATQKLMERFYTYLWVDGLPMTEALWKAKCDLRKDGHPVRHWAAWVISGDPD